MLTKPSGFLVKPFDKVTLQSCIDRVFKEQNKLSENVDLKSLKVQQKMNVPYFVRAHKKFLVNIKKIDKLYSASELLINGQIIPIGSKFRADLLNKIDKVDY